MYGMTGDEQPCLLLFGASGAIGTEVATYFEQEGWRVIRVSRNRPEQSGFVTWDPLDAHSNNDAMKVMKLGRFDAVCWAQGSNCNDSIYTFDEQVHQNLYKANVLYVLNSMNRIVMSGALATRARLCVISSIWQDIVRQQKLSYSITKSALKGLVLSAANDLGRDGILVNAVLPGVLDTPMTHRNLTENQLSAVSSSTQHQRLPALKEVAYAVFSLCSASNTGITGQFISVDLGYSNVRII